MLIFIVRVNFISQNFAIGAGSRRKRDAIEVLMVNAFGQHLVCEDIQLWSHENGIILVSSKHDYYPKFGFVPTVEYMLE